MPARNAFPGSCVSPDPDAPAVGEPGLDNRDRHRAEFPSDRLCAHAHVVMVPVRAFHADAVHAVAEGPELVRDRFRQQVERHFACLEQPALCHAGALPAAGEFVALQTIVVPAGQKNWAQPAGDCVMGKGSILSLLS